MDNGQAGFFTKQELDSSAGVLWDAESADYTDNPRLDPHPLSISRTAFSKAEVEAFTAGDLQACFGEDFYWAKDHAA